MTNENMSPNESVPIISRKGMKKRFKQKQVIGLNEPVKTEPTWAFHQLTDKEKSKEDQKPSSKTFADILDEEDAHLRR
jgi:hypothetical protein